MIQIMISLTMTMIQYGYKEMVIDIVYGKGMKINTQREIGKADRMPRSVGGAVVGSNVRIEG